MPRNRSLLLAGMLTAVLALVGCGRGGSGGDVSTAKVQSLVDQALEAMRATDSYKASFTLRIDDPDDVREAFQWQVDYQAPDSYRYFITIEEGEQRQVCEEQTRPNGFSTSCSTVFTRITGRHVADMIVHGDQVYYRQCVDIDQDCGTWEADPRPHILAFGLSTLFVPGWPLLALEIADDLTVVDGGIEGSTNIARAVVENIQRAAESADATELEGYEDYVGDEAGPDLALTDTNLARIHIDLAPDHRVHKVVFLVADEPAITIEYSHFNEIRIEAPE